MLAVPPRLPEGAYALFLDVDGTLLNLADTPDRVTVSGRVLQLVESARLASAGALALVSGRSLADLDQLFSPLLLPASGLHGAERRDAQGSVSRPAADPRLAGIRDRLEHWQRQHPGTLIEDKVRAVALHFRLAPEAEPAANEFMQRLAGELTPDFLLQHGKRVLELRPSGASKATAIEEFMQEPPYQHRVPIFFGDDVTDEDGFQAVRSLGGYAIAVGPERETAAQWALPGVSSVLDWIENYVQSQTEVQA